MDEETEDSKLLQSWLDYLPDKEAPSSTPKLIPKKMLYKIITALLENGDLYGLVEQASGNETLPKNKLESITKKRKRGLQDK